MSSFFTEAGLRFVSKDEHSYHEIKVVGVGGGGSNTVNHMFRKGSVAVDYAVCNTDKQALGDSPVPQKIQLGKSLTEGLGAGSNPEVGRKAARESDEDIRSLFPDETKMVFVTAGMGGGTGTGAAPIIAKTAKGMGKLTVGIVTTPFEFECRDEIATEGIAEMRKSVDSLIVINNNRIFDIYSEVNMDDAFAIVNEVLCTAASSIAEVINQSLTNNVDLADTRTLLTDSGTTLLGSGRASGPDRVKKVTDQALTSPLLNDADIYGAKGFIFVVKHGAGGFAARELREMTTIIRERSGNRSPVKWGMGLDDTLAADELNLTVIAAGFPHDTRVKHTQEDFSVGKEKTVVPEGPLPSRKDVQSYIREMENRAPSRTEERTTIAGEKKVINVYDLRIEEDAPPRIVRATADSFVNAGQGAPPDLPQQTYQWRADVRLNPLNGSINEVLFGNNPQYETQPPSRPTVKQAAHREVEPAYLRRGITVNINPPREGRTHTWTLALEG